MRKTRILALHPLLHPQTKAQKMTKVVNIHKHSGPYTYIGRAGKNCDGYFGNPFQIKKESERQTVIQRYKNYLWGRVSSDPEFRTRLWALNGHTLGCFCAPSACHGDIIADWHKAGGPYKSNGTVLYMNNGTI